MRLLHIGSGYRPLRRGGLVAYVEDLMDEQVRRGHEVSYFFSGREYPFVRGPRLRRWERRDVAMLEVLNSPLYDHGRQPELEVTEPHIERVLERLLTDLEPDVVHVQELAGLPFSLLDVIRRSGIPAVVTLQDYFPLCSTFKLLDADGRVCLRREIGADCVASTTADPRPPGLMLDATIHLHLRQAWIVRSLHSRRLNRFVFQLSRRVARAVAERRPHPSAPPASFQRRREMNIERLNRADCLLAMSHRVAEIYSLLGVDKSRLRTLHLTLAHIERLRPRRAELGGRPLTFATLGGFDSEAKGARLLIEAIRLLSDRAPEGSFRVLVLGAVDPRFASEARDVPGIEIGAPFRPDELDRILDGVDVGLMPSIWEEAYGYVGVEFLAKGIPVIANAIGGMPEYVRDGETGWLNRSRTPAELARIMARVLEHPKQVVDLSERLLASRASIIKPMAQHGEEIDDIYRELIEHRARA